MVGPAVPHPFPALRPSRPLPALSFRSVGENGGKRRGGAAGLASAPTRRLRPLRRDSTLLQLLSQLQLGRSRRGKCGLECVVVVRLAAPRPFPPSGPSVRSAAPPAGARPLFTWLDAPTSACARFKETVLSVCLLVCTARGDARARCRAPAPRLARIPFHARASPRLSFLSLPLWVKGRGGKRRGGLPGGAPASTLCTTGLLCESSLCSSCLSAAVA